MELKRPIPFIPVVRCGKIIWNSMELLYVVRGHVIMPMRGINTMISEVSVSGGNSDVAGG
jgi:hypothetical protein